MGGIFLNKSKVSFIHIPKTGGQSIRQWMKDEPDFNLMPLGPSRHIDVKHPTLESMKSHFNDDLGYVFAVVRNPYDRIISKYHHLQKVAPHIVPGIASFDVFVREIAEYDEWAKPQCTWFDENDDVDVFRYENLKNDFTKVQQMLNNYKPLPVKNASSRKGNWEKYYENNSSLKKFVYNKYKDDFNRFEYEKE